MADGESALGWEGLAIEGLSLMQLKKVLLWKKGKSVARCFS